MGESWSEDDASALGASGTFPSVATTSLGTAAIVGMAFSALYQLVSTVVVTVSVMVALGVLTYALTQYNGGLQTNTEEALAGLGVGAAVLLTSLIPLISALAAGFSAIRLWRGGGAVSLYVAATVSMIGPMVVFGAVSLSALASPIAGLVTSLLFIVGVVACLATGILAIVVASRSAQR